MQPMRVWAALAAGARESVEKALLDRVDGLERNVHEMFTQLQAYVRRMARTRDEGDSLSRSLIKLAESESPGKSCRSAVIAYACHLSAVQDQRNSLIERLEKRVIGELTTYGDSCKSVRESIRKASAALTSSSISAAASAKDAFQADSSGLLMLSSPSAAAASTTFTTALPQLHAIQVDRFEEKRLSDLKVS